MSGVKLDHVEARFKAHANRSDELLADRSMSARVIAFGTWLTGDQRTSLGARSGQLPLSRGAFPLPSRAWSNPWRPNGRAGGRSSPSNWRGRNRLCASMRRHGRAFHMPVQPRLIRPSGETQVISVKTSPAPPSARSP